MPRKQKGVYVSDFMNDKQIENTTKEVISIKNNDTIQAYIKKGYTVDDRKKIFSKYMVNRKNNKQPKPNVKQTPNYGHMHEVNIENVINNINGGCSRLDYY